MSSVPNFNANVLAATPGVGAVGDNPISYAGVCVITLAAPTADGQVARFWDEGGHAHTITFPAGTFNGAHTTATFSGTPGAGLSVVGRNGNWYVHGGGQVGITIS